MQDIMSSKLSGIALQFIVLKTICTNFSLFVLVGKTNLILSGEKMQMTAMEI